MCGICGWYDSKIIDESVLLKMTNSLKHRGPDNQNIKSFGNLGLGHARLSIIDLSEQANQPISNENNTIWLVYNGEFYNFKNYRNELIEKGHKFKSKTDSEVLLHLYEEHGIDFIQKIRGMFAFALWDKNKSKLILARDRAGIKPIYYYYQNNTLIFASELRSILQNPKINKNLDHKALSTYFMLGYIPKELSIFKNIKKLQPGHILIYKQGNIETIKYWEIPEKNIGNNYDQKELENKLYNLINQSVKIRMISDVPIGILLSGGLDSSIIATLMAKNSRMPIKTFSIGFEESKYNELYHARKIANHIGSDHYEFIVSVNNTDVIDKLIEYYSEPFADSSMIPTYFVSKIAREKVKVVLSGDGGDELFAGYNWYDWVIKQNSLSSLPFKEYISNITRNIPFGFPGKHFLKVLDYNEFDTYFERTSLYSKEEIKYLIKNDFQDNSFMKQYKRFYNQFDTQIQRMTKTDFAHYLSEDILTKVDRASMAVSLEARVPFLDHKICEFAFSLPDDFRYNSRTKKYLLKRVGKKILPDNFIYERKQGFSIPQAEWLRGKLGIRLMDLLYNTKINLFNNDYIESMYYEHKNKLRNHSKRLWPILIFLWWYSKFIK